MIRFVPGTPLATAQASWRGWNLGGLIEDTGGLKITRDERLAFVRAAREVVRVNMSTNVLTHWADFPDTGDPISWSDLALVERCGYIDVYSAHNDALNAGTLQRLTVGTNANTASIKRWVVDGGAGVEFLSGVAYSAGNGKVYFSEGATNMIGELDPNTNKVRRWNLASVDATVLGPRQISIDTKGVVWVVTASGHLVSLNPCNNDMAAYLIPGQGGIPSPGALANPFGVGTSGGVVGFTEADGKKIGMLIPNKPNLKVTPSTQTVPYTTDSIVGTTETINRDTGTVMPQLKENQPALHTDLDPLGEFVEATLPDTGNFPLGVFRDVERCVGNFWMLVMIGGTTDHRLSHVAFETSDVTAGGLVTGGGTIKDVDPLAVNDILADPDDWSPNSKANFGFNVYRKYANGPVKGNFNYINHTTGEDIKSVAITTLAITGDTATFSGTCTKKQNGIETACQFSVTVQDKGNPGAGHDTFQINGVLITPNGDTLNGGNIKIHN
jgi:streptogramin lyase